MDCLRGTGLMHFLQGQAVFESKGTGRVVLPPLYSSPQWGTVFSDNGGRAGEATSTSVPARGPGTALAYSFGGFED